MTKGGEFKSCSLKRKNKIVVRTLERQFELNENIMPLTVMNKSEDHLLPATEDNLRSDVPEGSISRLWIGEI